MHDNDKADWLNLQQAFGYTQEDVRTFLEPMAHSGEDPIGSMGTDATVVAAGILDQTGSCRQVTVSDTWKPECSILHEVQTMLAADLAQAAHDPRVQLTDPRF